VEDIVTHSPARPLLRLLALASILPLPACLGTTAGGGVPMGYYNPDGSVDGVTPDGGPTGGVDAGATGGDGGVTLQDGGTVAGDGNGRGVPGDAGRGNVDSGGRGTIDSGGGVDTVPSDVGGAKDTGGTVDAGGPKDTGGPVDAGGPTDTGGPKDTGGTVDAGTGDAGGGAFNTNPCWDSQCPQETAACKADSACAALISCNKTGKSIDDCAKQLGISGAAADKAGKLIDAMQTCGWTKCADPTKGTCKGSCGKYLGAQAPCNCDDACKQYKDCCSDYDALCVGGGSDAGGTDGGAPDAGPTDTGSSDSGSGGGLSCVGKCGKYDSNAKCQCDDQCTQYNDCCTDFAKACPGGGGAKCGDGKATGDEQCDGADLNNMKCTGLGYSGGTLKCGSKCTFNTASCSGQASCLSKIPGHACTLGNSACSKVKLFKPTNGYGYKVTHGDKLSWLRHDTTMLVKYAAASVACLMPGSFPLGLGDMSMADGTTPKTSSGQLRHPKTTHDWGRDIDIAYYQVGQKNNHLKPVCPHVAGGKDQYHCVGAPNILDVPRTTLFIGRLFDSPRVRVIGVDGKIGPLLEAEAKKLYSAGKISASSYKKFASHLAYETTNTGKGWYTFHHHHLHLSTFTTKYPAGGAPPPPPPPADASKPYEMPPMKWPIDPPQ